MNKKKEILKKYVGKGGFGVPLGQPGNDPAWLNPDGSLASIQAPGDGRIWHNQHDLGGSIGTPNMNPQQPNNSLKQINSSSYIPPGMSISKDDAFKAGGDVYNQWGEDYKRLNPIPDMAVTRTQPNQDREGGPIVNRQKDYGNQTKLDVSKQQTPIKIGTPPYISKKITPNSSTGYEIPGRGKLTPTVKPPVGWTPATETQIRAGTHGGENMTSEQITAAQTYSPQRFSSTINPKKSIIQNKLQKINTGEINQNYTGKGGIMKKFNKLAMSDTMGKILDNPIIKNTAIPLGNTVIKGIKWAGNQVAKDMKIQDIPGNKMKQQQEDDSHGGRYIPEKDVMQKAVKQAIKKTGVGTRYPDMAPLKTSMPLKKVKKSMPI